MCFLSFYEFMYTMHILLSFRRNKRVGIAFPKSGAIVIQWYYVFISLSFNFVHFIPRVQISNE